ncbi:MAG: HAMP domain-containing sensor histidine kinase [Betaproteobacteria bacterium]
MLHEFLDANRPELIERCRVKAARRPTPAHSRRELSHGIPFFLGQLITTLRSAQTPATGDGLAPEVQAASSTQARSELAIGAARNGHELLRQGFTVDEVVYNYGDLCQSITEFATESNTAVLPDEFRILNGCIDEAIADAVTEFGWQRDRIRSEFGNREMADRLGSLAHELSSSLNTAILSFEAIMGGVDPVRGGTSATLESSLLGLRGLIDRALSDARLAAGVPPQLDYVDVRQFIAEVRVAASLAAKNKGCEFNIAAVEAGLAIHADKQLLYSATSNLLHNAVRFTRSNSTVSLSAIGTSERVLIEIEDRCGGLPEGMAETLFNCFEQHGADRGGLGLGLSVSQRAVEACGGRISVRDIPSVGCVFTIEMPRGDGASASQA